MVVDEDIPIGETDEAELGMCRLHKSSALLT
jgi:hypothetical protein